MRLKFIQTKLFRVIFLTICVAIGVGILRSVVTIWQKHGIVSERTAVLETEEKRHAQLEASLRQATSAAFVEREARDKLGLVKSGETVVIMNKSGDSSSSGEVRAPMPLWQQWWQLFF